MISDGVEKAFNEQIQREMDSAYIYLSMSAYFHSVGLDGMAKWMKAQTAEEQAHAMRFFDHLHDRGGRVELAALEKPQFEWKSPVDAWRDALKHEEFITGRINDLAKLAMKENDLAALNFLQWFIAEQVEEEAQVVRVLQTMEKIGESGAGLVMLDHQLGERK